MQTKDIQKLAGTDTEVLVRRPGKHVSDSSHRRAKIISVDKIANPKELRELLTAAAKPHGGGVSSSRYEKHVVKVQLLDQAERAANYNLEWVEFLSGEKHSDDGIAYVETRYVHSTWAEHEEATKVVREQAERRRAYEAERVAMDAADRAALAEAMAAIGLSPADRYGFGSAKPGALVKLIEAARLAGRREAEA